MKKTFFFVLAASMLLCSCEDVYYKNYHSNDYLHLFVVNNQLSTDLTLSFYGKVNGKPNGIALGIYKNGTTVDYRITSTSGAIDEAINPTSITARKPHQKLKVEGAYIIPDCRNAPQDTLFIDLSDEKSLLYTRCYHEDPTHDLSCDEVYRHFDFEEAVPADHIIKYLFTIDDEYIAYLRQHQSPRK